jgi:tetratricopeptide (TPR) repeat protein
MRTLAMVVVSVAVGGCSGVEKASAPTQSPEPAAYSLSRSVAEHPKDAAAWERLGWQGLLQTRDFASAAAAFARALELQPHRAMCLWGVYLLAEDHGDLGTALDMARALLRDTPDFPLADVLLVRLARLHELGLSEAAAAALQELLASRPAPPASAPTEELWTRYRAALLGRGAATGPPDEGAAWLEELRTCHRLFPRFAHVSAELASAETSLNARWQAYRSALAEDPDHLRARVGLASVLLERGLPDQAQAELERAARSYPRSPLVLVTEARVALALGRQAAAIRMAQDALFSAPGYLPALRVLVENGQESRTAARQEELARQALTFAPGDPALSARLAEALQAQGKGDGSGGAATPTPTPVPDPDRVAGSRALLAGAPADETPLPIPGWLAEARTLQPEGSSTVMLYNFKRVEVGSDGEVLTRRRLVASVREATPGGERFSFDESPETQELQVLRAERRSAAGELRGIARQIEGPSPLAAAIDTRLYRDERQMELLFDSAEPGDVLDVEVALRRRGAGARPWLGELAPLSTGAPTVLGVFELSLPRGLEVRVEGFGSVPPKHTRSDAQDRIEHRFEARLVPGIPVEPMMPATIQTAPYVVASTMSGYDQVARWYRDLAGLDAPPAVDAALEEAARTLCPEPKSDPAGVAERAYDLVHETVRYVGFEFGQYDFKPHAPAEVLRARYGDCKDQARLLVDLLGRCGVDAEMVMLRTRSAGRVHMEVPYVGLFNHAIVYLPGPGLYLDSTAPSHRFGELASDDLAAPALRIRGDAALGSTPGPKAEDHREEVRMRLRLTGGSGAPVIAQGRREVLYTGLFCPPVRAALAGQTEATEKLTLQGASLEAGDFKLSDRPSELRLSYRIRFPLAGNELPVNLVPLDLVETLGLASGRVQPLRLRHPLVLRSEVELDLAALELQPQMPDPLELRIPGAHYRFEARRTQEQLVVLTEELEIDRLEVPASEVAGLYDLCARVDRLQRSRIAFRATSG